MDFEVEETGVSVLVAVDEQRIRREEPADVQANDRGRVQDGYISFSFRLSGNRTFLGMV
jgi:hypothetical protein